MENSLSFEAYARAVFESLPFFIAIDDEDRIVYINRQYSDALGIPQERLIGEKVSEVLPWSQLPLTRRNNTADTGCVTVFEPDRGLIQYSNNVCNRTPVTQNGKVVGAVGITTFTSFRSLFDTAKEAQEMLQAGRSAMPVLRPLDTIIGESPVMQELKNAIRRVAESDLAVCITGETGTGKELVANALHAMSARKDKPFVKINCAAMPKDLIESELFGYVGGAFTGASKAGRVGKFLQANGGTILLDEIGEMPMDLQAKLLRVLQEKQIEPIGSNRPIDVDVRILSATNRNLWEMVEAGKMRQDLFYRINAMEITAPPLRRHLEDLPLLCNAFISACNQTNNTNVLRVSESAYQLLRRYDWPGNVRELENVIQRACVLKGANLIEADDLKFLLARMVQPPAPEDLKQPYNLRTNIVQTEKETILAALIKAQGNKSAAARALGIDRTVLYAKMKRYQIRY